MNLSPLQKLDRVLEILNESYESATVKSSLAFVVQQSEINLPEIQLVLDKLVNDKYVDAFESKDSGSGSLFTDKLYRITYDGLLFIASGGYQVEIEMNDRNVKKALRNDILVAYGTWFAGIVGMLVLLWYIYSYFHPLR